MGKTERVSLGYRPHRFQRQVHLSRQRFRVCVAHRRFGKTVLAIMELVHRALKCSLPDGRYYYLCPTRVQAKAVAWSYLTAWAAKVPGTKISESELWVEFVNGARIRLFGADNGGDHLRGLYIDGIVIDEVADMAPAIWGEIIRPALSDRHQVNPAHGWALFIGTPKGINLLSERYEKAQSDPDWDAFMFRADETALIGDVELGKLRNEMSDNEFRQEMLCDFTAAADNVLIPIDLVSDAAARRINPASIDHAPRVMGVDVARFGDDRSVIFRRQGLGALEPDIFNGLDNMALVGRIVGIINAWTPDAVFIDGGRGEGVIDRLRQLGYDVVEVQFGGKADSTRYVNKRGEMWDRMRQWLVDGGVIPNLPELKTDLAVPTYDYDSAGKFRLESKDAMKERGMRSPDTADALALTFAYQVQPRRRDDLPLSVYQSTPQFCLHDYDPFAQ